MRLKVLITGGSGLVGTLLSEELTQKGYEVVHISRHKSNFSKYKIFLWDISKGLIEDGAFENVKHIIHLAGAGVVDKKWTDKRKIELASSRIDSANLIFKYLESSRHEVESFVSASAIGIYGFDTGGILQTEDRIQLGDDFLATLTKKWEAAADQFSNLDIRVVKLRIGLVLSEQGGLLGKLVPIAYLGISSAFGSGDQFMSWIHVKDLSGIFMEAVKNKKIQGTYNAVAPNPVSNKEFLKSLAGVIDKPYFLPNTPKCILKLIFGELSSVITGGNKVSSKKIEELGFSFQFPEISSALKDLKKK